MPLIVSSMITKTIENNIVLFGHPVEVYCFAQIFKRW